MKSSTIAAAALAALVAACAASAQTSVYRWVDKDGKVHFSDAPPASDARDVTQKQMGGGTPDASLLPFATQTAMQRNPVTMYVSNDCGDLCTQGRTLLSNRGIPYSVRNAETTPAHAEALKKLIGALQVPALAVGQTTLKGFDEGSWQSALDTAGYPRARQPGQPPTAGTQEEPAPEPRAEAGGAK